MNKKVGVIVGLAAVILFGVGAVIVWGGLSATKRSMVQSPQNQPQGKVQAAAAKTVTLTVKEGTDDSAKVVEAQQKLAKLFLDYRDAQLMTNGLLLMDPSANSKEDYLKFNRETIDKWKAVEADADAIGALAQVGYWPNFQAIADAVIPAAHAQENAEVELGMPRWDQVDMVKSAVPKAKILELVKATFGVSAKEAQKILEEHYQASSVNYASNAAWYDRASKTSQAINTGCKVGLFIGGAVITAGGTAVLTMPVGAAVATGFGSSLTAGGAAVIGIGGVDTVLEINEQGAQLFLGDSQSSESFAAMRKPLAPITTLLAIKDLRADGLSNPGNIYNAYDVSAQAWDAGKEVMNMFLTPDGKVVVTNVDPATLKAMSKEELMKKLPAGKVYKELSREEVEKMVSDMQNTAPYQHFGSYLGKMDIPFNFNGAIYHFDAEVRGTVSKTGEVKLQISDKGSFSYGVQGVPATANYTMKGESVGTMDNEGNIKTSGKFNTSVSVDIPGIENLPPQVRSQLNGGSSGVVTMNGAVSDKVIGGEVTFSAGGKSETGTWSAEVQ